ncbi:unnamed protein product [Notodromas monacha]|uniref:HTH TFE/IIEalpha-type domain-containing protein n=1 Tax=Notodromas monacha TaxID=399045 RepID=A0A7R9BFT8_9CRUS|nr:unnamed protein product [Notodromas monacha]CAG0913049.1 unnamed protein product [Notodromas monacha]
MQIPRKASKGRMSAAPAAAPAGKVVIVTEVPTALKQLARLVSRGFYSIEDSLIVDILVRNPCMKEDDICDLLKLEKKQLRARIATLKNDRFIQVRLKVETGQDGKAQRVNYYYVNYKSLVNVVKYKLDHIRRKLDARDRDEANRASFQCRECQKTFTDLEVDQLYNFETEELRCTFCNGEVLESVVGDTSGENSERMTMQKFNEQLGQLFVLLGQVEGIQLAAELLAPEPTDMAALTSNLMDGKGRKEGVWSGEATRNQGLLEDTPVTISFGKEGADADAAKTRVQKDRPIWMTTSTIVDSAASNTTQNGSSAPSAAPASGKSAAKPSDDIMSFLMAHEMPSSSATPPAAPPPISAISVGGANTDEEMEDDEMEDSDGDEVQVMNGGPCVTVGGERVPLASVDASVIARMSQVEKDEYIRLYQENFSHMFD